MRILVACGGTGGHILPALSFLERLKSKRKDLDAIIVVTKRKIESQIIPKEYRIVYISVVPIRFRLNTKRVPNSTRTKPQLVISADPKNVLAIIKLFVATVQSIYTILRFHPEVVVGFGGYASFALVFFAKIFGIKTIIHEQNVVPGISNKLLARFADRIAISFKETHEYLKAYSKKIILTGNPRCNDLPKVSREEALDFFGFSKDKFTILVMGGSQGSQKINNVFIKALLRIQDKNNLQAIHLSGMRDFDNLLGSYKKMDMAFKLFKFLSPMHYAYCAADLVITRAGATTIGEIIFYGLPAIVIPYPFAYQHQLANAKLLAQKKAAVLIEDNDLNVSTLRDIIMDLFSNRDKIDNMRIQYRHILSKSYRQDLSDIALSLMA